MHMHQHGGVISKRKKKVKINKLLKNALPRKTLGGEINDEEEEVIYFILR